MNGYRANLGILMATLLASWTAAAHAQDVPEAISFTARLTDAEGEPITGPVDLKVAIYDAGSGGALIWEEALVQVDADASGVLVHELGNQPDAEPLDAAVFGGQSLYLDVTINGEVLAPRVPIMTVPYAFRASVANSAETLGDLEPRDVALADHSHDSTYLRRGPDQSCPPGEFAIGLEDNGGVPELMCQAPTPYTAGAGLLLADNAFSIANNSIGSSEIVNGSVSGSDLASNSITADHIQTSAVGAAEIAADAVRSSKIADGSIKAEDIATGAVGSAEIEDGSITGDDIAAGSVGSAEIDNSSITSADIASDTITAADIAADAVGSSEIASGAVRATELKGGGVALYEQNWGCSGTGLVNYLVTPYEKCVTIKCSSSSYYACTGQFGPTCDKSSPQTCDNRLLGYLAAP